MSLAARSQSATPYLVTPGRSSHRSNEPPAHFSFGMDVEAFEQESKTGGVPPGPPFFFSPAARAGFISWLAGRVGVWYRCDTRRPTSGGAASMAHHSEATRPGPTKSKTACKLSVSREGWEVGVKRGAHTAGRPSPCPACASKAMLRARIKSAPF